MSARRRRDADMTVESATDNNDSNNSDGLVPVHVGITCAEAIVYHIPALLRLPESLADGLIDAVATGRADDFDETIHPAIAALLDWLEEHRDVWEVQLDPSIHTQDGEDLDIRFIDVQP
jgi:hypothetical protein